jgi:hypothetical protein
VAKASMIMEMSLMTKSKVSLDSKGCPNFTISHVWAQAGMIERIYKTDIGYSCIRWASGRLDREVECSCGIHDWTYWAPRLFTGTKNASTGEAVNMTTMDMTPTNSRFWVFLVRRNSVNETSLLQRLLGIVTVWITAEYPVEGMVAEDAKCSSQKVLKG